MIKELILFIFLFSCSHSFAEVICGDFKIASDELEFTKNEKIFICGSSAEGWRDIPKTQAGSNIKAFLAGRGYFEPEIKEQIVYPGKRSYIKKIHFNDAPQDFFNLVYIDPIGKVLNEDQLKVIESWTKNRLETIGYPCADITLKASYSSETVEIFIKPNSKIFIKSIIREDLGALNTKAFKRYDAIKKGDLYNIDYLDLTSRRAINSGIVSYSYFNHDCKKKPNTVNQKIIINKPNQIILGFGASTEEFPIFKANWRNTRLNRNGSTLETLLYYSSRKESIEVNSKLFLLDNSPKLSIKPFALYEKLTEDIYEIDSKTFGSVFESIMDIKNYAAAFKIMPSLNKENQVQGQASGESNFYSTKFIFNIRSHYYEYFFNTPKQGHELNLSIESYNGSNRENQDLAGKVFYIGGTQLFNIGRFDPPAIVLGVRFHYTTLIDEKLSQTPQKYRLYLGGASDIRGFARKSINNNEVGFKTTSHLAIESRFNNLLPYNLQPLLFIDLAKVGIDSNSFSDTLFYSPGLGLRWQSPFGSFRTTLARGMIDGNTEDYEHQTTLFLSYGKEF